MGLCDSCLQHIGICGQNGCLRERLPLPGVPVFDMTPQDWLAQCPYCASPVFRMGEGSAHDFDWRPWSLDDEIQPEGLKTAAQKRRWAEERPYRLSLEVINFQSGQHYLACDKAGRKPRSDVLYRAHWCDKKEWEFYEKWQSWANDTTRAAAPWSVSKLSTSSVPTTEAPATAGPTPSEPLRVRSARSAGRRRVRRP